MTIPDSILDTMLDELVAEDASQYERDAMRTLLIKALLAAEKCGYVMIRTEGL